MREWEIMRENEGESERERVKERNRCHRGKVIANSLAVKNSVHGDSEDKRENLHRGGTQKQEMTGIETERESVM